MQLKSTLIFFFLNSILGYSQELYQTNIYNSLEEDIEYQELNLNKEQLTQEIRTLLLKPTLNADEEKLTQGLVTYVEQGLDTLLISQLDDPKLKKICSQYDIDKEKLISAAKEVKNIIEAEKKIRRIYAYKKLSNYKIPIFDDEDIKKEIRKYKLKNDEKILEIGAGTIQFSKQVGKKISNSEIFLNEIDKYALKEIYFLLTWDKTIRKVIENKSNKYFVIKGGEKTTGVEQKQFDKIIIRNTVHHFSEPDFMFHSIKRSMNENTELIIRDRFKEECEEFCCKYLLTKNKFESILEENGFIKTYAKKLKNKKRNTYWIYKYKKNSF